MPTCSRCGADNPEAGRFCESCGHELVGPEAVTDDDTLIMRLVAGQPDARGEVGAPGRSLLRRGHLWLLDPTGQQVERAAEIAGDEPVLIGRRADATVVLPSNTVSRRHAQIRRESDGFFLSDLGSTNGTLLNGEPVIGAERLDDRDEIAVGIYRLIFRSL
jgi:hypothetical protein